jgi:tyrosyl-tRNA synthetase
VAAQAAEAAARQTFEEGTVSADLPTAEVRRSELDLGIGVLTAFSERARLVASNGEARRQIKAGGLRVNDQVVSDDKMVLTARDLTPEGVIKLSLGRKRHVLLKPM